MKRVVFTLALALTTACNNPDQALTILGIPFPDMSCKIQNPPSEWVFGSIPLDLGAGFGLSVPVAARNNLAVRELSLGKAQGVTSIGNAITPTRFVSQWECDTNNTANLIGGGFFLPRFSVTVPYCLSREAEFKESTGFDVIAAAGPSIEPSEVSTWAIDAVPVALGRDFDEMLRLAVTADRCSRALSRSMTNDPNCTKLEEYFGSLNPKLPVRSTKGDASADTLKFAQFAILDGEYITREDPDSYNGKRSTPSYSMRLTGVFEGFTGYGQEVQSNEFAYTFDICRNCGLPNPAKGVGGRDPVLAGGCFTK